MCEFDSSTDVEQPGIHRGCGRSWTQAEILGGGLQQKEIAQWLRRGGQGEQLRFNRKKPKPLCEALFDPAAHRLACRNAEPARKVCGVPGAWQFEQRKRIAVALRDDLLADGRVDR